LDIIQEHEGVCQVSASSAGTNASADPKLLGYQILRLYGLTSLIRVRGPFAVAAGPSFWQPQPLRKLLFALERGFETSWRNRGLQIFKWKGRSSGCRNLMELSMPSLT
jgi:hypothetical protein